MLALYSIRRCFFVSHEYFKYFATCLRIILVFFQGHYPFPVSWWSVRGLLILILSRLILLVDMQICYRRMICSTRAQISILQSGAQFDLESCSKWDHFLHPILLLLPWRPNWACSQVFYWIMFNSDHKIILYMQEIQFLTAYQTLKLIESEIYNNHSMDIQSSLHESK